MGKNLSRFELNPLNAHNIQATRLLTAKETKGLYTKFEDDCQRDEFPLIRTKELLTTKSCIPIDHDVSDKMIKNISHSIDR